MRKSMVFPALLLLCASLLCTIAQAGATNQAAATTSAVPDQPPAPEDAVEAGRTKQLNRAGELLSQGKAEKALAVLDALIADYTRQYANDPRKVYCARSLPETLLYMAMAATQGRDAVALGPTLAYAHHLRGYALIELGRNEEARVENAKALELSPDNPTFLAERGYQQQLAQDWPAMLATYQQATEMANAISPDNVKSQEAGRALRGQGYALVELGRLDAAEQAYRKALALDANDTRARDELEYVRQRQTAGK